MQWVHEDVMQVLARCSSVLWWGREMMLPVLFRGQQDPARFGPGYRRSRGALRGFPPGVDFLAPGSNVAHPPSPFSLGFAHQAIGGCNAGARKDLF